MDVLSKVTDQNIKNVYNMLEKHKIVVEDRLGRIEERHDKLKAHFGGLEESLGTNMNRPVGQLHPRHGAGLSQATDSVKIQDKL